VVALALESELALALELDWLLVVESVA